MQAQALTTDNERPRLQRARGEARVIATVRDGQSHIASLYQDGSAKVRLPHTHDGSLQAVLMNTAGGLTDGDHLRWTATAGANARMVLTTPACERVYRSLGADAHVETHLIAEAGARIDWLPQETILFEGGRLARTLDVDLGDGAVFTGIEAILLGREAMGEAARGARLSDKWRIRRNGRLIHAEATRLGGDPAERDSLSLLNGALAFATILHVASDARRQLDTIRALLPETGGASVIGERLVVRIVAESGLALRRSIAPIIAVLSGAGSLPRLWLM
jgi:urease accessory protein